MKNNSFFRNFLACVLSAAMIAAVPAYVYAAEPVEEEIVFEDEDLELTESPEAARDETEAAQDETEDARDPEASYDTEEADDETGAFSEDIEASFEDTDAEFENIGVEDYDHLLTLNPASDYDSVNVYYEEKNFTLNKGDSFGFKDGHRIDITGVGDSEGIDNSVWQTYISKWTLTGEHEYTEIYTNNFRNDERTLFTIYNPTENYNLTVEARQLPLSAITAKGRIEGNYTITASANSKKGNICFKKAHENVKVSLALKKTGSVNYEISSDAAAVRYGSGSPEDITLTKDKNSYSYEIPFYALATIAYSDSPAIEFTASVAAKLPSPTAKVTKATDIDATVSPAVPAGAKNLKNLWYKIEAKANVANGKTLPAGMAETAGPLYVPSSVTAQTVYLMAEPGKEPGSGAAQKYDFSVTLLQLENEPAYHGEPITDKSAVEGSGGENIVGASPAKKVSGTTQKPGYEEKLGLKKVSSAFIVGQTDVTLATAKFGNKTAFRALEIAEITDASGTVVRTSDTDDDFQKLDLDGDKIILEESAGLMPGGKYTLTVWPVSREGGKTSKPAKLAITPKQGIDELTVTVPQESYVKKAGKALTVKPAVTYNGGERSKAPAAAARKLKWELLDAEGNDLTDASPLYGKYVINQKTGAVTFDKNLEVSGDPAEYSFVIFAAADDYEENMAEAKSAVVQLTKD
ncbi:MAG: hypothetical protein K6G58_04390 [Lachnospiraceae bacterium]|nr:hypothetical protein [Lachnospiraceae bacterium]